jgi:hypothetical protein
MAPHPFRAAVESRDLDALTACLAAIALAEAMGPKVLSAGLKA